MIVRGYDLEKPIVGAPNFRLQEFVRSQTAARLNIDNFPNDDQIIENLYYLARNVLQPLRDAIGKQIKITSGYRCPALNAAVGGSPRSFHCYGQAVDLRFRYKEDGQLIDLFKYIYSKLKFTELIAEELPQGWIHIAYAKGRENERQLKYKLVNNPVRKADYQEIVNRLGG